MSAVITNIDQDHMDTYGHDFGMLKKAFVDFVHQLPFYGSVVLCADDPETRCHPAGAVTPACSPTDSTIRADYRAEDVRRSCDGRWHFRVRSGRTVQRVSDIDAGNPRPPQRSATPWRQSLSPRTKGSTDEAIVTGLAGFSGVGRRFQITEPVDLDGKQFAVVDDYGHHPTEVEAVISTARDMWPQRRLVMCYQPHRYTRTRDLYDDFVRVLSAVDVLICLEVYAAGEAPIAGADGKALCQGIRQRANLIPMFVEDPDEALRVLADVVEPGDVVLVQGAGNVNRISNVLGGQADG